MLNALRHQRFGHDQDWILAAIIVPCSTPYGIRGLGTDVNRRDRHRRDRCSTPYGIRGLGTQRTGVRPTRLEQKVLNALRHQRFGHSLYGFSFIHCFNVLNALRHQRFGHISSRGQGTTAPLPCSTPYGIRGLGTAKVTSYWIRTGLLCSTPYGIRGLGTSFLLIHQSRGTQCAQRLTASEVWAQQPANPGSD